MLKFVVVLCLLFKNKDCATRILQLVSPKQQGHEFLFQELLVIQILKKLTFLHLGLNVNINWIRSFLSICSHLMLKTTYS